MMPESDITIFLIYNFWIIIFAFFATNVLCTMYIVHCIHINIMKIQKQRFWYNEIAARRRFSVIEFLCFPQICYVYIFHSLHISTIKKASWFKRIRIICSIQSCCGNEGQWLSHGSHFSLFIRYFSFILIQLHNYYEC